MRDLSRRVPKEGFQLRNVEGRVDPGFFRQGELVSHNAYELGNMKWAEKSLCQFGGTAAVHSELSIRTEAESNPVANLKNPVLTVAVGKGAHAKLSQSQVLFQNSK